MKKRLTMFLACLFLSLGVAMAQTQISGTVVSSEDGQPIIGASVMVVGTNNGTATDIDGRFSLSAPAGSKITVSYIGMQTVTLPGKSNMKITLDPDQTTLDDVMVVAYGTQKKSAFTGSAAVVKSEDITKVQVTNAVDALKGKVSGVQMVQGSGQPGNSAGIRIRGIGSISSGGAPLYIVDGSPFDGDLNTINPQDIESMTVLKDAASAALYGSRGANGVIMITTKTGRADRATVTVDAKWGVNSRAVPDYEYINDPAAYYEMYYKGLYNYAQNERKLNEAKANKWVNSKITGNDGFGLGYNVYTVPKGEDFIGLDGKINPNATLGRLVKGRDGNDYWIQPDNWTDLIYKNSLRQEYSMTALGNTDKSTFYLSLNYLDIDGITVASDYNRLTGRLKSDFQVKEWLKLGANVNYAHYTQNSIANEDAGNSGNMFAYTRMAPIYPAFLRDANRNILMHRESGIQAYDYGSKDLVLGLERPYLNNANELSDIQVNKNYNEGNTINAVGTAEVRFLKDFKFTSTNSVYLDEYRGNNNRNPWFGLYANSNGIVTVSHGRTWSYNLQQLLNWRKMFDKHEVEAMVGHEYYRLQTYTLNGEKSNMFSNDYDELSGAVTMKNTTSGRGVYNTEGWFGRMHYSYADRYFGELSYRRDASSRFHPNNRWGNFWSIGGAWLISKEEWFNAPWVDELKFKASYGAQGNDGIGNFLYTKTFTITPSNGQVSLATRGLGNEKISWEKQGMFNVGFDFALLRHRLTGSIVYFDRSTKDMLSWFSLPASYGWTGYYDNIGDMSNRGIEFELNGDIIRTKDLVWSANFNITSYKNKITRIADSNKVSVLEGYHGYNDGNYFLGEGLSMFTYRVKKYAGVDPETGVALYYKDVYAKDANGQIQRDANGEAIIAEVVKVENPEEAQYHLAGTSLPDAYGGFGTNLAWKGFDIAIDFTYQLGGQVMDSGYQSAMNLNRGTAMHVDLYNAWSADNKTSNIPRVQYNDKHTNTSSDRWLTSASYLSLQNVNLGYTLPRQWTRKIGLEKVRIYAVGNNLYLWSKRKGLDPRQTLSGAVSNQMYSSIRTISGGLTVTF